jgi:hypothetical protein
MSPDKCAFCGEKLVEPPVHEYERYAHKGCHDQWEYDRAQDHLEREAYYQEKYQ